MSDTVIKVENLSKKYLLRHQQPERYTALRDVMTNGIKNLGKKLLSPKTSNLKSDTEDFFALRNVSFAIKQGDRVGIIGRNGAGKSTLLKILSRITEPTSGRVEITGRVASLLEVGTGFHPELTGRENIFLNGAILGMRREEIKRKFDEIVDFAEVEKFLDTPVKHFSSGMYMRLAFAVAAHLEPDILSVDEVLAVGDAQFQKKCLYKMKEAGMEGRTVLFVSHNMPALLSFCSEAIWLENGLVKAVGASKDVVARYLQHGAAYILERKWNSITDAPGNEYVRLNKVKVSADEVASDDLLTIKTPIKIELDFWNYKRGVILNVSLLLYNIEGVCIFDSESPPREYDIGMIHSVCHIPANFLNDSVYSVELVIAKDTAVALLIISDLISFEVHDVEREGNWYGKWSGVIRPNLDWETSFAEQIELKGAGTL